MVILDLLILLCIVSGMGIPIIMGTAGLLRLFGIAAKPGWLRDDEWGDESPTHARVEQKQTAPPVGKPVQPDPLPGEARERIAQIQPLLDENIRRIGSDPASPQLAIEMKQMKDNHLPALIRAYEGIPPAHRRDRLPGTDVDATQRLCEGLDRMLARVRAVENEISRGSLDAFADNARFVAARYGERTDDI